MLKPEVLKEKTAQAYIAIPDGAAEHSLQG